MRTAPGLSLLDLPEAILLIICSEYLSSVEVVSSFGSLSSSISGGPAFHGFWTHLYLKVTRTPPPAKFGRSSRSQRHPRLAYFSFIRMSWVRQQSQAIRLLEREDTPKKLKAVISPGVFSGDQLAGLMMLACYCRRSRCVKSIIADFHADYNAVSSGGTVLIVSAWQGDVAMVRWLVRLSVAKRRPLELDTAGALIKTSSCGGRGPFTAKEWAKRKAALHSPGNPFEKCVAIIEEEECRRLSERGV